MAISLDQLLYGVRQVESGGNYSVVNSIGAVGAYQVMKANIPSWTKKALGYSMTWQQFRDSRAAQDAVARTILGGYYKKYGAEGAASMWFSGQPNPNSSRSDGGNTVAQYVSKVIAASGGGSITSDGGSYSSGTAAVVPSLSTAELAETYGLTSALVNSSKELKSLFNKAVAGSWSADKFQAELKNSKWWKSQSSDLRKYITTKYTDPATWKQSNSAAGAAIKSMAVAVGVDPALLVDKAGHWTKFFSDLVYKKEALSWTDARLKEYLGLQAHSHGGVMWGEAGEAFDKLHEVAFLNGMSYSADWFAKQAVSIVGGRSTQETAEATIRSQAAARYSAYRDQILAGQNAMDLAAPYIKSLSSLLELPETDVDLANKYVAKAMTAKPATGAQSGSQMPLWQFENEVRADPLWRKTNNARESMMSVARQVAKDFGLAY
ncbi:transglycosylase SLT domain-containing protein [Streptomyces sp. NPDC002928]|uniref:transglycosylase SLT domain-containing protein n=1 Tax=Streptomyces sp. NPDC002928 TaxID=3154440 RepID=UPI0033AD7D35